jgi:glucose-6-phosphate dehydrogenase assembly protein OpcA
MLAAALDQARTRIVSGAVEAEADNPAAELLSRWLEARLNVTIDRIVTAGPVVTAVRLGTEQGEIVIDRPEGPLATLTLPDQPSRTLALKVRTMSELIAEELRRLDADEMYAVALRGEATKETV